MHKSCVLLIVVVNYSNLLFFSICLEKVMPDFALVYTFLGSIFDPSTDGHLQKLKEMDPIDVETVCNHKFYIII